MEEAVARWQREEEAEEVGLRGRRSRQPSKTTTTSTAVETRVANGVEYSNDEEEHDENNTGYNEDGNRGISPATDNLGEQQVTAASSRNSNMNNKREGNETEINLEEVYKKQAPHEFLCPNCNASIQTVIVREFPLDSPQPFRCSSCFTFLLPAGDWFFCNFVPDEERRKRKQEIGVVQDSPDSSLTRKTPLPAQIESQPSETLHHESNQGSSIHNAPPPLKPDPADIRKIRGSTGLMEEKRTEHGRSPSILIPVPGEDGQKVPSESRDNRKLEILKSIVYGGLTESITSLTIVTSAASADAATSNIVALALANLVGGFLIIGHNLRELKNEAPRGTSDQTNKRADRYQEQLGERQNFVIHATVALLSFLIFGLVPPVVYGFSFRKSDNKDYKLAAVAATSLLCIIVLAICKAYVQRPPKDYFKTVIYYAVAGFMASGVSYIAGYLIRKLIENFGLFTSAVTVTVPLGGMSSGKYAWASY